MWYVLIRSIWSPCCGEHPPLRGSDHRSDCGGLPEQLAQALQTLVAERTELLRMQRLHGCLQPIEQLASFLRDLRRDHSTVGRLPSTSCQRSPLEAIEQSRHVRIARGGAFSYDAERRPRGSCVPQNSQYLVLLRGDAGRLEQCGKLIYELAGDVLEQEIDLPLS